MDRRRATDDDYKNIVEALRQTWAENPAAAEGFLRALLREAIYTTTAESREREDDPAAPTKRREEEQQTPAQKDR
jgi:hypothetical protein